MMSSKLANKQVGAGADTIALSMAEDAYLGNAEFTVSVDGVQIGGVQTVTAAKAAGASQTFDVDGNFGAGAHTVAVDFLNDAYGGNASLDRNLYVLGASYDSVTQPKTSLSLYGNGAQTLTVEQASAGPKTIGSGADTIALSMAEDAYLGNAEFTVSVDGVQIGGVQTVTAAHAAGASQTFDVDGDFGAGSHTVAVNFLNDAYGGNASLDRNLYVLVASYDGVTQAKTSLSLYGNGAQTLTVEQAAAGAKTIGSGADTIALSMAEDAYLGNAEFTVSVDGVQIGGVQTVTAAHATGASQTFDVDGNFGAGSHTVAVDFLNDAYGGNESSDRNIYVLGASYDGVAQPKTSLSLDGNGAQTLTVGQTPAAPTTTGSASGTSVNGGGAQTPTVGPTSGGATTSNSGSDVIALSMAEDAYAGDAEFTVSVDGVQIGGVRTVTAANAAGASQVFDVDGNFGAGVHTVAIDFLNDGYGGNASLDRNLYLTGASYDGVTQFNKSLSLFGDGSQSITVREPTTPGLSLLGVNLSGAEYGSASTVGYEGTDYVMPTNAELDYYASKGMNIIRLPFLWERMQPTQGGPLNQTYLAQIDSVVDYANSKGMKVDLDAHNGGQGYGNVVGSAGTPASSLDDLWSRIATHYAQNSNVLFGIMNEPTVQSAQDWATIEEGAVQAIRATGAVSQEILASGVGADSGINWDASGNAAVLASTVLDPNHNIAFEVHQYLDANSSGVGTDVTSATIGPQRLADVTSWAQNAGVRLFLGEFGAASDPSSLTALNNTLSFMQQHNDVWQGGTYWAGGQWWGNYPFSIEPANGVDKAQMGVLHQYVAHVGS